VRGALDIGVSFFDTANIYGQGDSERFLGAALKGHGEAFIVTKAGQVFPPLKRAMIPLKKILRPIVNRRAGVGDLVKGARAAALPRDWSESHLSRSLEKSLRRLQRDQVSLFMLHSPDAETLRRGDAIGVAERLKAAGKAAMIGASVDDIAALEAALADARVQAVQFPLNQQERVDEALMAEARARGVMLIAREILGGGAARDDVGGAIAFIAGQPVDVALVGTSRIDHLAAIKNHLI
jgi:aryl-alcohol dehydrogenase-like predicted oxidoreductase